MVISAYEVGIRDGHVKNAVTCQQNCGDEARPDNIESEEFEVYSHRVKFPPALGRRIPAFRDILICETRRGCCASQNYYYNSSKRPIASIKSSNRCGRIRFCAP